MSTDHELLDQLNNYLDAQRGDYAIMRRHWQGKSPLAYLSKKSRDAIGENLQKIGVNFPRLVANSKAERLNIDGLTTADGAPSTAWDAWIAAGMKHTSDIIHVDYTFYGAAYATVWALDGRPTVTADTPGTMYVHTDPVTGEPVEAIRRWSDGVLSHAVTYEQDHMTGWTANGDDAAAAAGWKRTNEIANPFGVLPVVPFIRRVSADDHAGTSAVADILDLTDAVAKLMADAMVTSERYARPRRWATGLEIEYDDDGNAIDPFGEDSIMQSEATDTKFGQFNPASLDSYTAMIATLTQQIGALTGLPAHYLGLQGMQAPNAESVRAAEIQLSTGAYSDHRRLTPAWERVAGLLAAAQRPDTVDPRDAGIRPHYASPETLTWAQSADAAGKLKEIGVPLADVLPRLGYTPEQIKHISESADRAALSAAAANLGGMR